MPLADTRAQIVEAADQLFYEQGYEHTSFASIASAVQISRGNFYHHFKSKDEILEAVIARRLARTQQLLDGWQQAGQTPLERLRSFVQMLVENQAQIMKFGCPVGTLCTELAKLQHGSQAQAALLFGLFRGWLAQQFRALGRRATADRLALHLLARSQGVATLAQALGDAQFVQAEVRLLHQWLEAQVPTPA